MNALIAASKCDHGAAFTRTFVPHPKAPAKTSDQADLATVAVLGSWDTMGCVTRVSRMGLGWASLLVQAGDRGFVQFMGGPIH